MNSFSPREQSLSNEAIRPSQDMKRWGQGPRGQVGENGGWGRVSQGGWFLGGQSPVGEGGSPCPCGGPHSDCLTWISGATARRRGVLPAMLFFLVESKPHNVESPSSGSLFRRNFKALRGVDIWGGSARWVGSCIEPKAAFSPGSFTPEKVGRFLSNILRFPPI